MVCCTCSLFASFSCLSRSRNRTMNDVDAKDVVSLVVGNIQEEKTGVVDCLTNGGSWDEYNTAAGVRILTNTSGAQVVDTTPLRNVHGRSATAIARRWISQNSLRRIVSGKVVFVVCVITNAVVQEMCNTVVFTDYSCWLDILGLIVGNHKDIMIVAVTEDNGLSTSLQHGVENCLRRHQFRSKNVLFSNWRIDDSARLLVEASVRNMCPTFCLSNETPTLEREDSTERRSCGRPFRMGTLSRVRSGRGRFGPWGPERVFLFGRTGSGKSTLAQMLTLGKLDQNTNKFKSSSGIRGGTEVIEHGEGRGWYVVDTPGFGEPESEASTVSTLGAQRKVKKFVEWEEGTFSHYLFVLKKDRIDKLEVILWKFFKLLCGEEISHHFSIVISDADHIWLEENISHLQNSFEGCNSFLTAEFPPTTRDEELETAYAEMRTSSLREMEEELAKLGRSDLHCEFGEHSKMNRLIEKDRAYVDSKVDKNMAVVVDILDKLGFLWLFTSLDDVVHLLTNIGSTDKITLENINNG